MLSQFQEWLPYKVNLHSPALIQHSGHILPVQPQIPLPYKSPQL